MEESKSDRLARLARDLKNVLDCLNDEAQEDQGPAFATQARDLIAKADAALDEAVIYWSDERCVTT